MEGLTFREKYILNCLVESWDDAGASLYGDISYEELFAVLDHLDLKRPEALTLFLESAKTFQKNQNSSD